MILNLNFKPVEEIVIGDTVLCTWGDSTFLKIKMKSGTIGETDGGMIVSIAYDEQTKIFYPNAFLDGRKILNVSF
jgi:hypothetical protein